MDKKPDDIDPLKKWNIEPEKETEKGDPMAEPWDIPGRTEKEPKKENPIGKPWDMGPKEEPKKGDPLEGWEGFPISAPKSSSEEIKKNKETPRCPYCKGELLGHKKKCPICHRNLPKTSTSNKKNSPNKEEKIGEEEMKERNRIADAIEHAIENSETKPSEILEQKPTPEVLPKSKPNIGKSGVEKIKEDRKEIKNKRLSEAAIETKPLSSDTNTKKLDSSPELEKEIENLTPEEKEKVTIGLHNIGFIVEKKKSEWFAETFDWISKKGDQKGTVARFTRGLRDSFKEEADMAQKKIAAGKKAGAITKLSNIGYLAKNILRPIRLIADATGMSPTGAQRIVMAGSMASARITGAMKEARLANEEVLEKNRISLDKATEEAWKIYENAKKKVGPDGNVSALELKTAYLHEIPKDLQERLKNTTVADGMVQGILRKHLDFDVNRLNKDTEKVEKNKKLSSEKMEAKKEELLRRWEKRLTDYDRVLTQTGTVDGFAMAARYAESSSKNITRIMTAQTLCLTLDKIWDSLSQALSSHDIHPISIPQDNLKPVVHASPTNIQTETLPTSNHALADVMKNAPGVKSENIEINPDAIIGKGEGIEHALGRQIEHNAELAKSLGYKEGMDLHKFSGAEAHRMALNHGYVNKETGEEIWVKGEGKVAYEIKMENGHPVVNEKMVNGTFNEEHAPGSEFEKDIEKEYEYKHPGLQNHSDAEKPDMIEKARASVLEKMDAAEVKIPKPEVKMEVEVPTQGPQHFFPGLSPGQNDYLNSHRVFIENDFHLKGADLLKVVEAHEKNINYLFPGDKINDWENLKNLKASSLIKTNPGNNPTQNILSLYLRLLQNFANIEPKTGFLGIGSENAEEFAARALQKIKLEGNLETFEDNLHR